MTSRPRVYADRLVDAELVRVLTISRVALSMNAVELAPHVADRLVMRGEERVFVPVEIRSRARVSICPSVTYGSCNSPRLLFRLMALLLEEFGIEEKDVQQVLLAGSFGSYHPRNAIRIARPDISPPEW